MLKKNFTHLEYLTILRKLRKAPGISLVGTVGLSQKMKGHPPDPRNVLHYTGLCGS